MTPDLFNNEAVYKAPIEVSVHRQEAFSIRRAMHFRIKTHAG